MHKPRQTLNAVTVRASSRILYCGLYCGCFTTKPHRQEILEELVMSLDALAIPDSESTVSDYLRQFAVYR